VDLCPLAFINCNCIFDPKCSAYTQLTSFFIYIGFQVNMGPNRNSKKARLANFQHGNSSSSAIQPTSRQTNLEHLVATRSLSRACFLRVLPLPRRYVPGLQLSLSYRQLTWTILIVPWKLLNFNCLVRLVSPYIPLSLKLKKIVVKEVLVAYQKHLGEEEDYCNVKTL
jgi:hypothetical protein